MRRDVFHDRVEPLCLPSPARHDRASYECWIRAGAHPENMRMSAGRAPWTRPTRLPASRARARTTCSCGMRRSAAAAVARMAVDIGCGAGTQRDAAGDAAAGEVLGTDLSWPMLRRRGRERANAARSGAARVLAHAPMEASRRVDHTPISSSRTGSGTWRSRRRSSVPRSREAARVASRVRRCSCSPFPGTRCRPRAAPVTGETFVFSAVLRASRRSS